jgi:hypothetical protein
VPRIESFDCRAEGVVVAVEVDRRKIGLISFRRHDRERGVVLEELEEDGCGAETGMGGPLGRGAQGGPEGAEEDVKEEGGFGVQRGGAPRDEVGMHGLVQRGELRHDLRAARQCKLGMCWHEGFSGFGVCWQRWRRGQVHVCED